MTELFFIFLVSGRKYHYREDRKLRQTSREKREANRRLDDLIRGGSWLFPVKFVCEIKRMDTRHARASFYTLKHKESREKYRELVGFPIQDPWWCEGHKETVLGQIKGEVENDPLNGFDHC